jgi:hypothetical protein
MIPRRVLGEGEVGGSEDASREARGVAEGGLMRPTSIVVLMIGLALLGISSCATAPTKPLAPGEMRLLSVIVPEKEKVKTHLPFVVNISFEADGQPEIRSACFSFAADGPHCYKVTDVNYGSPGTIKVQIHTKNPGSRLLEGYVLYVRDGKIERTNMVSTYFHPAPQ